MSDDTTDEPSIKRELRSDFDRGFSKLVRAYQPGIHAGAYRLTRNADEAADIAQETFVRAYGALSTYDRERIDAMRLASWLWTIALNECRNRWRRQSPQAVAEVDLPGHVDPEPADGDAWRRRLAELTDTQRTAVVLRYVVDLSVNDIAEVTERPEATVRSDIARGLDRLRRTIAAEEQRA